MDVIKHRWLLWPHLALITTATAAAYLGLIPVPIRSIPYSDKVFHFVLFGALSALLRGWTGTRNAILLTLTGAGLEELAQSASPLRSCDIWDFAADAAGVLAFQVWAHLRR